MVLSNLRKWGKCKSSTYAFSNPDKVRKELSEAIDTLLLGANQKYKD